MFRDDRRLVRFLRGAAWVVALLAVFIGLFGVGAQRWPVAVAGGGSLPLAGLLAGAGALVRRLPVSGTAQVLQVDEPGFGTGLLRVAVQAPGIRRGTRLTVPVSDVPAAKWPSPGDRLPVQVVTRGYLPRVRVLWDRVAAREPLG